MEKASELLLFRGIPCGSNMHLGLRTTGLGDSLSDVCFIGFRPCCHFIFAVSPLVQFVQLTFIAYLCVYRERPLQFCEVGRVVNTGE